MIEELNDRDIELAKLTDEQLVERLDRMLSLTAHALVEASKCWAELEDRGYDVSAKRIGPAVFLPAIHAGTVIPEAVWALHKCPSVLNRIAKLTPNEQRRIVVEGDTIEVVEQSSEGSAEPWTYRNLTLQQIIGCRTLVNQVFGDRCIRSKSEQIAHIIGGNKPRHLGRGEIIEVGNWIVDKIKRTVKAVRGKEGSIADIQEALRLAGFLKN